MKKYILILVAAGFFYMLGVGTGVVSVNAVAMERRIQTEVELPVLMYHRVFKGGQKSRYIITPNQLEEDLIALKNAGYTAVFPSEVLAFVHGEGHLPPRPVMLTFDDGHYNNLLYALPLFQKHGFKGVVHVVGKFCEYASTSGDRGKPQNSFLTWEEVAELRNSGLFEIGSHTYNMHDFKPRFGIRRLKEETDEKYREALTQDDARLKKALKSKAGVETNIFAYPFGAYYPDSRELINALGYKIIFTANIKINNIRQGDLDALLTLGRINREGDWTSTQMLEAINAK